MFYDNNADRKVKRNTTNGHNTSSIARKVLDLPFSTEQVLQRKEKGRKGKG